MKAVIFCVAYSVTLSLEKSDSDVRRQTSENEVLFQIRLPKFEIFLNQGLEERTLIILFKRAGSFSRDHADEK